MLARAKFRAFQKYCVYYGSGQLERLSRYDVVMVEPLNHSTKDIEYLRASDTIVLAYVSVMEVHPSHPLVQQLTEGDYLRSGQPPHDIITQPEYGTCLLDLASSHWRGILLKHIGHLLLQEGYDGVFLDTIGDVERADLPNAGELLDHAVSIVHQIRQWFPDKILVQNNGLEMLCAKTASLVDGIVWENPPLDLPASRHWVNAIARQLLGIRDKFGVRIMILFEGVRQDTRSAWLRGRSFSSEYVFTPYFSPEHYQAFH